MQKPSPTAIFELAPNGRPARRARQCAPSRFFSATANPSHPYWPSGRGRFVTPQGPPCMRWADVLRTKQDGWMRNGKFFALAKGQIGAMVQPWAGLGWDRSLSKDGRRGFGAAAARLCCDHKPGRPGLDPETAVIVRVGARPVRGRLPGSGTAPRPGKCGRTAGHRATTKSSRRPRSAPTMTFAAGAPTAEVSKIVRCGPRPLPSPHWPNRSRPSQYAA